MIRARLLTAACALCVSTLLPLPAFASVSPDTYRYDGTNIETDIDPCTGEPATLRYDFSGMTHTTQRPDGTVNMHDEVHGQLTIQTDSRTYNGRFGVTDSYTALHRGETLTETFRFTVTSADGYRISATGVAHTITGPDGAVLAETAHDHLTCLPNSP